jgi:DNA-directed RNA polymerase specialized sigma24 family protein
VNSGSADQAGGVKDSDETQADIEIATHILLAASKRDREVLIRFYCDREPAEDVQRSLGLTETEFRLIKSRARERFKELRRWKNLRISRL